MKWNPELYKSQIVKEKPVTVPEQPLAIGTPFYYSYHFLDEYFTALLKLDYPKELLSLVWTVQGKDETKDMLYDFRDQFKSRYRQILIKEVSEITEGLNLKHVKHLNICACRNWIRENSAPDDLLFIGHDNFLRSNSVNRLLTGKVLGGHIVGGYYAFYRDGLGFTSFFRLKDGSHDHALRTIKHKIWFPACLLNKRVWTWTTGMDATFIRREVLNEISFDFKADRLGEGWTDDVEFCYAAHAKGFKVMTDYSLLVPHWGFNVQFLHPPVNGKTQVLASYTLAVHNRRQLLTKLRMSQSSFTG